jgi:alpha-N-arabinofuranosidase
MIHSRCGQVFLSLAAMTILACSLQAQQSAARIKIDTEQIIGEVDPLLFGNFTEHLGRCIYGGIFEEGSQLSDADGFRKDVMEVTRGLGVTILRLLPATTGKTGLAPGSRGRPAGIMPGV